MDNTLDDESVADILCDSIDDISDPPPKKKKTYFVSPSSSNTGTSPSKFVGTYSHMLNYFSICHVCIIFLMLSTPHCPISCKMNNHNAKLTFRISGT